MRIEGTLLLIVTALGCSRRTAQIQAVREGGSGLRDAAADVTSPVDDEPPDGSIVLDPESNAWQGDCAVILSRAVRALAKRDARFATSIVATGEFIDGRREVYLERALPGVNVGAISYYPSGSSSGGWQSQIGTFDGGRQLHMWRYTSGSEAKITLRGLSPSEEASLAATFKAAADQCIDL